MQAEGGMIERYGIADIQEPTDANSVPSIRSQGHRKKQKEGERKAKKKLKLRHLQQ